VPRCRPGGSAATPGAGKASREWTRNHAN